MLDARAQYAKDSKPATTLDLGFVMENGAIPVKSEPRVHKVWIHAFEMETGDYFWGGFMSLVTESDRWVFQHPDVDDPYSTDIVAPDAIPANTNKVKKSKNSKETGKK